MLMFTAGETAEIIGAKLPAQADTGFFSIETDTRKIKKGALFIALQGENFNGEDFVPQAEAAGAAGAVVTQSCRNASLQAVKIPVFRVEDTLQAYQALAHSWRLRHSLPVVAVTGSNGKTTTKDILASILSVRYKVQKTQGNFNNEIGLPLTLLGIRAEHGAAVVEMGMRGLGQIRAMAAMAVPDMGIITNVGETHMELLGSLDNIARAKFELAEAMQPGQTVILNADNIYTAAMASKVKPGVKAVTFGLVQEADVKGSIVRSEEGQTVFTVRCGAIFHEYSLPLLGRHNVLNALAAMAAAWQLGFSPDEIQKGFAQLVVTGMRFECQDKDGVTLINDAYNASPMSMRAAIDTLAGLGKKRMLAVLGDMLELGRISEEAHREVGHYLASRQAAVLITLGRLGEEIARGARAGGMENVHTCASHEEAAAILHGIMQPGDAVLFKGSHGMHMEKIIDLL